MVLEKVGEPMRVEEIPTSAPKDDEVLIRVAACGICHSDLHVAKGEFKFPLPCVPGHEISGTVESLGPGVAGLKPGDRVVASFIMPCGRCSSCARGRDDLCEPFFALNRLKGVFFDGTSRLRRADGSFLAMYSMGGLAEFAVVPATDVFPIPASLAFQESCILGCAIMTACGAVKNQAGVQPGQTVAVVGAGGVGSNVIQLALSGAARWSIVFPAMANVHMLIGLGEALITALVLASIARTRPELFGPPAQPSAGGAGALVLYGTLLALGLAIFVSPLASALPDGLEHVVHRLGLEPGAARAPGYAAPLAEYRLEGLGSETIATAIAGAVGTVVVLALAFTLARARVAEALAQVGLAGLENRAPHRLSGGEKRRVCLAGVLACQPRILVLDEPTSDLDPRGKRDLRQLLRSIPVAQLIATHDLELVVELCSRVVVLDRGTVVAEGPTVSVLSDEPLMLRHDLERPHILAHRHPH